MKHATSLRSTALWTVLTIALLALASWGVVVGIAVVARAALLPIAAMMVRR